MSLIMALKPILSNEFNSLVEETPDMKTFVQGLEINHFLNIGLDIVYRHVSGLCCKV